MFKSYWDNYYNSVFIEYYVYLVCWVDASGLMS